MKRGYIMASFTKLSDNEMNYYQFKAKAVFLQKKEEKEWQDFCKQVAPDCAACLTEKADVKETKDAEMQTFPKKPFLRAEKTPLKAKYKSEEIPEDLIYIKTRLEKIDLALSKLIDESEKNKEVSQKYVLSEKKPTIQEKRNMTVTPAFPSQQAVKTFEEQRKLQIHDSLKRNIQNSTFVIHKKSPAIKTKHSSFFLPHDLEVKRAAARKAYLASLQIPPKVSILNKTIKQPSIKEKAKTSQNKKNVPTRKKMLPKKENQKSKENTEETLIKDFVVEDTKDENIEGVVDAIFDDLLREVTLDLNRIRQKKRDITDREEKSVPCNPSTSSPIKWDSSKHVQNNNNSIMKLKMFVDLPGVIDDENILRKQEVELENKKISTPNTEDSKAVLAKRVVVTSSFQRIHEASKTAPKFVCGVKNIIKIDPLIAKNITSKRDRFWRYLESISQIVKGDFNPWILNESLAESILDDCINDIAEELNEMPSTFIQDLYNQEFVQQVET